MPKATAFARCEPPSVRRLDSLATNCGVQCGLEVLFGQQLFDLRFQFRFIVVVKPGVTQADVAFAVH